MKYPIECKLLHNLNFDDLADARDGEVALATRADHDRVVSASLFVNTVFSVHPGALDDQGAVGIRASFVGHAVSLTGSVTSPPASSARLLAVAFGQQSGPPASMRQIQELLTLLKDAGHTDFRDARGPMGFTQRQAAGKFTRDEATGFIDQLQETQLQETQLEDSPQVSAEEQIIRGMPAEKLAAELERRGWTVVAP